MTSGGQRTAFFLVERFRVLFARTDLREECDITDDNASLLLFVSRNARLGIVSMSLSRYRGNRTTRLPAKDSFESWLQEIVI